MVHATPAPPEPPSTLSDPRQLLSGYLDYYRDAALRKLDGLPEHELRRSRLPSGWTPLELLKHLAHMEQRWLRWGFTAERVRQPWGDRSADGCRWEVRPDESVADVVAFFREQCARSREIVAGAELDDVGALGGRFGPDHSPPTLIWILFHVLQEYARHVGHLDIVRELADSTIGE